MNWLTFGFLAAGCFGFYNVFIKLSADKLSPTIALMFIAGTSFIIAVVATIIFKLTGQDLVINKNALIFPILAGVSTGIAEIFYLFMYSKNAPVSIGTPFVLAGTMLVAVLFGALILKEGLPAIKIAGIVITIVGLFILSR